ncbi:hypothetical protein CEP54_007535 [Fusarium duplospermum]|uniref:Uncharacterized protein n=1 Tax=Fusarium duplospermum TaxID=1325734 RepID=A0A428Q0S5_9HYPO|nr:hypothetical protein CEP54_007535 [Fusarium duplospermum]
MQSHAKSTGIAWKPSWKHAPWLAFASILGFVVCCVGLAAILFTSDGENIAAWPSPSRSISVSVLLSLAVSLANLCLAVALHTAYEISWWTQALNGAELRKLQFDLDVQRRISAIFGQNVSFDKFAIAAVVSLAVSILDGPLIQRASSVTIKEFGPSSISANVDVSNAPLPSNFSTISNGFPSSYVVTPLFSNISRAYANRDDIVLHIEACTTNTTCDLTLPAPGFDVSCTEKLLPYDIKNLASAGTGNQIASPSRSGMNNQATAFNISVRGVVDNRGVGDSRTINITAMYKPKATRAGDVIQRECVLRLATVRYPITVSDGVVTLKSWQLGQNDTIALIQSPSDSGSVYRVGGYDNIQTMLGGFFYVLDSLYTSYAVFRLGGKTTVPLLLNATGQAASNYINSDISTYNNWTMTWEDPTTDIVNAARELMLRSAIAYSDFNRTAVVSQQLEIQRTEVLSAYKSDYMYLAITLACMVLQALIIAFLLFGWHRLGREVSLDAFEVARALGAPLLQGGSSNSAIHQGLSPLRRHRLRYGEILSVADQVQTGKFGSHEGVQLIGSEGGYELQSQGGEKPELALGLEEHIGDLRPDVLY